MRKSALRATARGGEQVDWTLAARSGGEVGDAHAPAVGEACAGVGHGTGQQPVAAGTLADGPAVVRPDRVTPIARQVCSAPRVRAVDAPGAGGALARIAAARGRGARA